MEKVVEWWDFIITYTVCQQHQNGMLVNGFGVESAVFHMKPNNYFNGPVNSTVSMNTHRARIALNEIAFGSKL